jgi:hypothetical protein
MPTTTRRTMKRTGPRVITARAAIDLQDPPYDISEPAECKFPQQSGEACARKGLRKPVAYRLIEPFSSEQLGWGGRKGPLLDLQETVAVTRPVLIFRLKLKGTPPPLLL